MERLGCGLLNVRFSNRPFGVKRFQFVAPPWGTALDETIGLDLRLTTPPITQIIRRIKRKYLKHKVLFATQVYEKVNPTSLAELERMLDWTELRVYDLNVAGRNHGILLGTWGWKP